MRLSSSSIDFKLRMHHFQAVSDAFRKDSCAGRHFATVPTFKYLTPVVNGESENCMLQTLHKEMDVLGVCVIPPSSPLPTYGCKRICVAIVTLKWILHCYMNRDAFDR